jgi:hypothetical protein
MDSYLEHLRQELEDATRDAGAGESVEAPPGKWSAAQILEHLFLTYKGTNRGLEKCVERSAPLGTSATLKHRAATMLVVGLGYLPGGRTAPERATPRGMPLDEVRQAIGTELQKMASNLDDCERRFGARTRILDHPFLGPLTAREWRKFHLIHGRHHLRQFRERLGKS